MIEYLAAGSQVLKFAEDLYTFSGKLLSAEKSRRLEFGVFFDEIAVVAENLSKAIRANDPDLVPQLAAQMETVAQTGADLLYGVMPEEERIAFAKSIVDTARAIRAADESRRQLYSPPLNDAVGKLKGVAHLLRAPLPKRPRTDTKEHFWKDVKIDPTGRVILIAGYIFSVAPVTLVVIIFLMGIHNINSPDLGLFLGAAALPLAFITFRRHRKKHAVTICSLALIFMLINVKQFYRPWWPQQAVTKYPRMPGDPRPDRDVDDLPILSSPKTRN